MYKIELFKDNADSQSLEAPLEIRSFDDADLLRVMEQIIDKSINYDWSRMVITKL